MSTSQTGSAASGDPAGTTPEYAVGPPESVDRRPATQVESVAASRHWWDAEADDYYQEHGGLLGDAELMWGPEGVYESDLGLLGEIAGQRVLEFGAGAAQGSRWCARSGAHAVATDISAAMLARGRALDTAGNRGPAYVQCDATRLPFADATFDTVFSAYGALPFVADSQGLLLEVARVLRPGGQLVFALSHPIRWTLPDVPGPVGLTVRHSYFDRNAYVEADAAGQATYVEHHRTIGDRVREIVAAGLRITDLVEPQWPEGATHEWGGWSRLRGTLIPGTAIFVCRRDP